MELQTAKNRLQEIFQKKHQPLPTYETIEIVQNGQKCWQSHLYFSDNTNFIGSLEKTKIKAECSVAFQALEFLSNQTPTINKISRKNYGPTVLIVDVENLPKFIDDLPYFDYPIDIYAFVGKYHPLADKSFQKKDWLGSIKKILSPSTRLNGTDTCIQLYVGKWLTEEKYEEYLIATQDNFGATLVELITNPELNWQPKRSKLITRYEHFNQPITNTYSD